jgi:phosphatidylserine synthase
VSSVFLYFFPPYIFEAGSLTGSGAQGFSWAGWSVSCGDTIISILCLRRAPVRAVHPMQGILHVTSVSALTLALYLWDHLLALENFPWFKVNILITFMYLSLVCMYHA